MASFIRSSGLAPGGPSTTSATRATGASRRVAAALQDGGAAWRVRLDWAEAGEHKVAITLGGAHVGGSPLVVRAESAAACLAASAFEGAGLQARALRHGRVLGTRCWSR